MQVYAAPLSARHDGDTSARLYDTTRASRSAVGACQYLSTNAKEGTLVARVEIGGRRGGQEVWARWIDGRVQGDREFLIVAGLDPGTRFEDPHAFAELIEGLLDEGSASVVIDVPERPA
jgi:hypothetical protein